jgi:hypothetical protein
MKYTAFTIHFKEGDSATFKDVPGKVMYDLKYPKNGALLVERCDGGHDMNGLPDGPIETLGDLDRMLKGKLQQLVDHEHKFEVMYAPGTWTRIDFESN